MVSIRRYVRALGIALVAIAGSFSDPAEASAETTGARSCCSSRPMTDCRCCVEPEQAAAPMGPMRLTRAHASSLKGKTGPCECRFNTPSAPASKSERPSSERKSGSERIGFAEVLAIHEQPESARPPARILPGASSAKAPLYRLTARLLC